MTSKLNPHKLISNQGFHDAYHGHPSSPPAGLSPAALLAYDDGYASGSRARPMPTIIMTPTGPFRTVCTGAQGRAMMETKQ